MNNGFGLNGVVKALKFVGPVIILLIVFVAIWTSITGWNNLAEEIAAIDAGKYEITQVGDGNPFASGAIYGGFVRLWFAAFFAEIGAKNSLKNVKRGMLPLYTSYLRCGSHLLCGSDWSY